MNHIELGTEMCEALGLNPATIRSLRIDLDVTEWPRLTTVQPIATTNGLSEVLGKYTIVPRAGWAPPWGAPLRRPAPWVADRPKLGDVYYLFPPEAP